MNPATSISMILRFMEVWRALQVVLIEYIFCPNYKMNIYIFNKESIHLGNTYSTHITQSLDLDCTLQKPILKTEVYFRMVL